MFVVWDAVNNREFKPLNVNCKETRVQWIRAHYEETDVNSIEAITGIFPAEINFTTQSRPE
jgi:hypothetical protein